MLSSAESPAVGLPSAVRKRVITSYSIHYTKLYEMPRRRLSGSISGRTGGVTGMGSLFVMPEGRP